MKKFIPSLLVFVFLSGVSVSFVYAQVTGPTNTGGMGQTQTINGKIENPFGSGVDTLQALFEKIINNVVIPIGGVLAVLAFIYSGFLYVTASGDETKIKNAHRALLYTAIGTAVLLGAGVISKVLTTTVDQLK